MLEEFKKHIEIDFPELFDSHFLIACSGGLDSMVLTELCQQAGLQFSLAHCNFRLRGTESDGDEAFVREQSIKWDRTLYVTHFDTVGYVNQHKVSVQMAARELRYNWFSQLMGQYGIPFLLTAHHANDNLETFLINLSRGTGIDGLTGIPSKAANLRRPLLPFYREELEAFAERQNLPWREDASNADTKYLRNKIRLEIIPKLKELHPTFLANFQHTLGYLNQTKTIASHYLEKLKKELFIAENGKFRISLESLTKFEPLDAILYGLFKDYGFTEWQNLKDLLDAMSGKKIVSNTHILLKDRDSIVLSPLVENEYGQESFLVNEDEARIDVPISLKFSTVLKRNDNTQDEIYIQKDVLKYPLTIRKWKKGDYFCPLGFKGKKKLSKFFKDEKMNVLSKNETWLLCSDNQIVWVIGRRADNRFRVIDDTKEILKIKVT